MSSRVRRSRWLGLACPALALALCMPHASAAPTPGKSAQKEHTVGSARDARRPAAQRGRGEPAREAGEEGAPSNRLEALHYFRDPLDEPALPRDASAQAELERLIAARRSAAIAQRSEAVTLLERFLAETPIQAAERPDALLRLSELRWEEAREDYLARFARWQAGPGAQRTPAPRPDYTRPLALYDRILEDHPAFARLDLVLDMKAFTLLELGDDAAALPLFRRIVSEFPKSRFSADAHMAIAEHVFNTEHDYRGALAEYDRVLAHEESELYELALFKSAWCLWQLDQKSEAAERFRKVLDVERREVDTRTSARAEGSRRRHLKELQSEALESLIQVFTEDEQNRAADVRRFLEEIGGERHVVRVLTRLSSTYYDQGRYDRGIEAYQLLIDLEPAHPRAPSYQLAVARGHMATDAWDKALVAYRTLTSQYGPTSLWATQQADEDVVEEAQVAMEQAVREQALSLHERGQRDNDKAQLAHAVTLYELYLSAFPRGDERYRIGFYRAEILFHRLGRYAEAGEGYLATAELNPKGALSRDALYNALDAFERVREQEIKQCAAGSPCPETENDRRFSRAIELYAATYPDDPDLPEILFRQGKLYYDRRVYDPAVRLFGELLERFPESKYAADAGELLLDSFHRAADYENIEHWSRKLKSAPAFRSAAAQKRLDGLILGAVFKIGEQLAEKGEHTRAAEAYLRAAKEFPSDPRAPRAYYNAGLELARAGSLEGADRAYTQLIDKYPGSSEGALAAWHGAEMYESIAQFSDAARFYTAYAVRFPKAEKAEAASYNAVLLLGAAGEHAAAIEAGRRYLARYPHGADADAVAFTMGRAQAARGATREAARTYRALFEHGRDPDHRIEAGTRLGELLLAAGDEEGADEALTGAVREGTREKRKLKEGRYFAAQARFLQGDAALHAFDAVKIEGDVASLGARLKEKSKRLAKASSIYGDVVAFGVAEWVTAALYKIGSSYERFAKALNDAPLPEGLSEPEAQVYRDELARFVVPIEERALEAYEGGYRKARELGIYNGWTSLMRDALSRLNEVAYPKRNELGGELTTASELPEPPVIRGVKRRREGAP